MNLALLVIDVQRGLFDPQPPPADADAVVERINALSAKAREAGMPVVFVQHERAGDLEAEETATDDDRTCAGDEGVVQPPAVGEHLPVRRPADRLDVGPCARDGHRVDIGRVPSVLHTPLMSVTNAISGIIVVGAILQAPLDDPAVQVIAGVAILFASINVFGGFLVTRRMLNMFQKG